MTKRPRPPWRELILAMLTIASTAFGFPVSSHAQDEPDFYRGKVLRVIVSTAAGGGYDQRGRALARHIARFLPGNPTTVSENMPGGGSVTGLNYLFNLAPKDGTVMLLFQRTAIIAPILSPNGIRFDLAKFNWLGSMGQDNGFVVASRNAPIRRASDVFKQEMIVASASLTPIPLIINALTGSKFKVISGYQGSGETFLAMQRGEVMGIAEWSWSDLRQADWYRQGQVNLIMQTGRTPVAETPDVPLALDFATSDENRRILEAFVSPRDAAYPFILPPGLPAERVSLLRKAFMKVGEDAGFRADLARMGLDFQFQSGDELEAEIHRISAMPPELKQRMRELADMTQNR